jgi:hypothetical protein
MTRTDNTLQFLSERVDSLSRALAAWEKPPQSIKKRKAKENWLEDLFFDLAL